MGDVVKSDYAVTSEIVKELLEQLDSEWEVASCDSERKRIADMGLVIAAGFLCGLRGEEIMKVDLGGLMKYLEPGRDHATCPHLIVALLGRLKGETGERYHMMVMSRVSRSGIVGGIWADRVVEVNRRNGRTKGQVRDWVPKTMAFKRGKRIRKGPGMPCVDEGSTLDTDVSKGE
jgi:hypothetical protein